MGQEVVDIITLVTEIKFIAEKKGATENPLKVKPSRSESNSRFKSNANYSEENIIWALFGHSTF